MLRRDLLRSTMDFNAQLQRDRLEDRKACFDLQTMVRSSLRASRLVHCLVLSSSSKFTTHRIDNFACPAI